MDALCDFQRERRKYEKSTIGFNWDGMIGKLHAETMSKMKDVEFVAASDVDAKHKKTAEDLGTNSTNPMRK